MWFDKLTGFREENGDQVRKNLKVDGTKMTSLANGKTFECGTLDIPSLKQIKESTKPLSTYSGQLKIQEVVGNVQHLHQNPENAGAIFQAASQFNLLEMVGPDISPEAGIDRYQVDNTQGPACAIACGAGTIYRNYFVPIDQQLGQTTDLQIDCLKDIGITLGNQNNALWTMRNGYALATEKGLIQISDFIKKLNATAYEDLKNQLKVGIQWNTEVTIAKTPHLVSQLYCSALPVRYSNVETDYWADFASLILEATYEATFYAALKNFEQTGNNKLYLTLVGGGAFGNKMSWIFKAIKHSVNQFSKVPLDVKIVSYGRSDANVREFINTINF